jgi:hypothetical protein
MVLRLLSMTGAAIVALGLTGCSDTWETVTSHRFRDGLLEHPYATVKGYYIPEDPMEVLRTDPPRDGDEIASAMRRLKEPLLNRGTQEDQDIIVNMLSKAACSDHSPVIRMEAIKALGRFQDPRGVGALMVAYQKAHGRKDYEPEPAPKPKPVVQASAKTGGKPNALPSLADLGLDITKSPNDYQPEWVTAIRCRALEALGRTGRVEAVAFLSSVAGGAGQDVVPEGSEDRDVQLAAVRALGSCRHPEAVIALARVLNQAATVSPNNQDTAMIGRAHDGLVRLTGKTLPPDPQQWNVVVQGNIVIAPEPGWWENTVVQVSAWMK